MFIKDGTYRSVDVSGLTAPILEGTVLTSAGAVAAADGSDAFGIVPETVFVMPPTKMINVVIGGTIDLQDPANANVTISKAVQDALSADINFIPGAGALPPVDSDDDGKILLVEDGKWKAGGDEAIADAVSDWLDDHPEATTTVEDGAVTDAKLAQTGGVLSEVHDVRVGADGVTYDSAGAAVRGQVADLIDTNISNPTIVSKKYVDYRTGAITDNNSYSYLEASGIGTYHKLHVVTHTASSCGICFYDVNDVFIKGIKCETSSSDGYLYDQILDVPDGVNIIRVSTLKTQESTVKIRTALKTFLDGVNDKINDNTQSILKTRDADSEHFIESDEWSNGGINGTNGAFLATNFFLWSGYKDVTRFDSIEITPDSGYRFAYAFYDSDQTTVLSVSGAYDLPMNSVKRIVEKPVGAKYFAISFQQIDGGTASAAWISHITVGGCYKVIHEIEYLKNMTGLISNTVKTIAHRGDDVVAPQCTAPAYIIARKHGHTIAENDLWTSEDGELLMWHDTTLSALGDLVDINGYLMYTDGNNYYWVHPSTNAVYTYDTDYVASDVPLSSLTRCNGQNYGVNSEYANNGLPLNVLKRIDFGAYKGGQFKGTQILTFEEWVLLCKQLGMEIYIDRKYEYSDEILTEAANIVKKCGMGSKASWLGLSGVGITLLRSIIPDSRCGLLYHPSAELIEAYTPYNVGRGVFFNGNAKSGMTAEAIQLGLNAGFEVEVWYVDYGSPKPEDVFDVFRTAVSYGVTGITTDHYRADEAFEYLLEQY